MDRARNGQGSCGSISLYQSFVPDFSVPLRRSGTDDFCMPGLRAALWETAGNARIKR